MTLDDPAIGRSSAAPAETEYARSREAAAPPHRAGQRSEPDVDGLGALDLYLRSIRNKRVLDREETYELARGMEAEEADLRQALYAVPATADAVLSRWRDRRDAGRVTAALSTHYREESSTTLGKRVDTRLRALERLVAQRPGRPDPALEGRISKALAAAEIALPMLLEIHRELSTTDAARADHARKRLEALKATFVAHNLRLVVTQAKRFRNMGVAFLDLIQEGNLGLVRAVEKFDHSRGFKFSTYAVWWIEQALIRAIQNQSRTVRVPSHIYELQIGQRRIERELRQRLGRVPTRDELAAALEIEPEVLDRVRASAIPNASLSAPVPGTDGMVFEDLLADEEATDPLEAEEHEQLRRTLGREIATLDGREREILEARFDFSGSEPPTLEQIGRRMGLSRERVRQLERRALTRLRERRSLCDAAEAFDLAAS